MCGSGESPTVWSSHSHSVDFNTMSRRESYPTLFDEVTNAPKDFAVRSGLRKTQVDSAVRWIGPPRGNYFLPSKEVEAMHSVSLGVAEDALFEAAERIVGDRDGNGHIYAYHADFDLVLKTAASASIVRENRCTLAKRAGVDQF
jgi:hypothetical protein